MKIIELFEVKEGKHVVRIKRIHGTTGAYHSREHLVAPGSASERRLLAVFPSLVPVQRRTNKFTYG